MENMERKYIFDKRQKLYIPEPENTENPVSFGVILGLCDQLEHLGYFLDYNCMERLAISDEETVVECTDFLLDEIKRIQGADVEYTVLFKNFPESCRNLSIDDLSNARFLSYFASGMDSAFDTNIRDSVDWDGPRMERREAEHRLDKKTDRVIRLADEMELCDITKGLLSSRTSLSEADKNLVNYTIDHYVEEAYLPKKVPFRENEAILIDAVLKGRMEYSMHLDSIDDLRRLMKEQSKEYQGSISAQNAGKSRYQGMRSYLGIKTQQGKNKRPEEQYRKFSTRERKILLKELEAGAKRNPEFMKESMMGKKNRKFIQHVLENGWQIDGERLSKFCPTFLQLKEESKTEQSKRGYLEQAVHDKRYVDAAGIAKSISDGEFMRRLISFLDKANNREETESILNMMDGTKANVQILMNAKHALTNQALYWAVFPANAANFSVYAREKLNIRKWAKDLAIQKLDEAIREQLSQCPPLGKVYIDPDLSQCPVPFAGRENHGDARALEKGTQIPLKEHKNVIRAFAYKEFHTRDGYYDLSASFMDQYFNTIGQCSWTNLKTGYAFHSGDSCALRHGFTECIDIDLEQLKKSKPDVKYVAFQLFSYGQFATFNEADRIFFGIQEREELDRSLSEKDRYIFDKYMKKHPESQIYENGGRISYSMIPVEIQEAAGLLDSPMFKAQKNDGLNMPFVQLLEQAEFQLLGGKEPEPNESSEEKIDPVFNPADVSYRIDVKGDSYVKVPMLYDVENQKLIVVDLDLPVQNKLSSLTVQRPPAHVHAVSGFGLLEDYCNEVAQVCESIVHMDRPDIAELARFNVEARGGELVDRPEDADIAFVMDWKDGVEGKQVTPFDNDIILSEFAGENKMEEEDFFLESDAVTI